MESLTKRTSFIVIGLILIFILAGTGLRLWALNTVPGGLFSDEVAIGIDAKTIAQSGVDQFGNPFPVTFEALTDFRLPIYVYLVVPFFNLLGPTIEAVRLPSSLASIISIFLTGYLAFLIFKNKFIGLYAMLVLAISPFAINFARFAYESSVATAILLGYLIFLWKLISNAKYKNLNMLSCLILIILGNWIYSATIFTVPTITFLIGLYLFIFNRNRSLLVRLTALLLGWFASFAPSFFLNSRVNGRPLSFVIGGIGKLNFIPGWLRVWNLEFLFSKGDITTFRHGTGENGVFLLVFIVPLFTGALSFIKNWSFKNFGFIFLAITLISTTIPTSITSVTPYGPRFLPAVPFISILIAYGIYVLRNKLNFALWLVVFGLLFYQLASYTHAYFVHYNLSTSVPSMPGAHVVLAQKLKNYLKAGEKIYFLDERDCRPWGHEELQLWYFGDLDNSKMIAWNKKFRTVRYASSGTPFDAYDNQIYPKFIYSDNLTFYPGTDGQKIIPKGALMVRCGNLLDFIDKSKEEVLEVLYLYPGKNQDPYYIIDRRL